MKTSQNTRILKLLSDGEWHSHHEIYALSCVGHSRIAELRKHGYVIEKRQFTVYGKQVWEYRLVGEVNGGDAPRVIPQAESDRLGTRNPQGSDSPPLTSSTDQPGQSQTLITRTGVRGVVSAEHLHADTLDLV
jgi:hypothetical protein